MATGDLVQGSFSNHLFLMKIVSIYPFDSHPVLFKLYSLFSYIFITIPVPILSITYLIVTRETDFYVIMKNGTVIVEWILVVAKLLPLKTDPKKIVKTIMSLNQEMFKRQLTEQDRFLLNVEQNCKFIYKIFSVVIYTSGVSWISSTLMYESKSLPMDLWFPIDPSQNVFMTLLVFFWFTICVAYGCMVNATLDTMIAFVIYHAIGQLRVLKDTLIHLSRRAEEEVSEINQCFTEEDRKEMKNRIIYQKICQCIEHYNAIYYFVQDIEETFTYTVFAIFLANIMVLGTCIVQLSLVEPFSVPFIWAAFFTMAVSLEQFLFCFSGEHLCEESIEIVDAIYTSEWYNFDEKSKRALITLMERTKKPMKITVGKLLELSLETFITILRRSYSLFAVLENY